MEEMRGLIRRLKNAGLSISKSVEKALLTVCISDFTDYEYNIFYNDRPVVFLETSFGGVKTISAPHMVVTLLHHLELDSKQQIVVVGAKGGYIAALIAHIIGGEGRVILLDPSIEIVNHVSNRLRGYPTIECRLLSEEFSEDISEMNRVLITGQIEELPKWIERGLADSGFAIAPIGNKENQILMKIENQAGEMLCTEMGNVVFGPLDIKDSVIQTPSPEEMAELVEQLVEMMSDMSLIEKNERLKLYDLVAELRQLPDSLPPPEEFEDPSQHPMYRLMINEGEWFMRFWPVVQLMSESRLANPGGFDNEFSTSHDDFVP
ncbi:MAG: hypothetical protein QGI21_00375 [Candidatus Poseidoniaceae archaeon]|jgi:protein-L-isoaspartate(D-aspartate) O-methyltransferase|nr:hypothetical protein [Candidatus Poseidoniaceae archaeon]